MNAGMQESVPHWLQSAQVEVLSQFHHPRPPSLLQQVFKFLTSNAFVLLT